MKTWICTLLCAWGGITGLPVQAQPAPAPGHSAPAAPGTVVLTAEELAQSGAVRLSDLFTLTDGWYAYSREGYTSFASADGLAPAEQPAWRVFVDGQPVDLSTLGAQHLNALPFHLGQLDSVAFISMPALVHGTAATGGVVLLHTRRPRQGLTVEGNFAAGNEINDPGPYRYTPLATPNIDRIGPAYSAALGYAAPRWSIQAGLKADQHHGTHPEILARVRELYRGIRRPRILLLAPSLVAETTAAGTHRLVAGVSRLEDLRYFAPLGLEVPARQTLAYLGASGEVAVGRNAGLRYRAAYDARDLGPRLNRDSLDFDWRQTGFRGNLEGYLERARLGSRFGVTLQQYETRTAYLPGEPRLFFLNAYGALEARLTGSWTQDAALYLTRRSAHLGFTVLTSASLFARRRLAFTARAAFARQSIEEENSLWYWAARGYGFLTENDVPLNLPPAFESRKLATLDLLGHFRAAPGLRFSLTAFARHHAGLTLPVYAPVTDAYLNTTTVHTGLEGRVVGTRLGVQWHTRDVLEQRLHVTLSRPVAEQRGVFRAHWSHQPLYRLGYTARFQPNERLSLYARLRYQSGTRWPHYERHGAQPRQAYSTRRPAVVLVDLTVQKRLWQDHLRGTLSLRNALNTPYLAEPAGTRTFMTLFVQLQATFNTGR